MPAFVAVVAPLDLTVQAKFVLVVLSFRMLSDNFCCPRIGQGFLFVFCCFFLFVFFSFLQAFRVPFYCNKKL